MQIELKELTLDTNEKACYISNNPVRLTKSEYNILSFLLNNRNRVFSREDLIKEAWTEKVTERAVDTAISRLRKKLNNYGRYIVSRNGFGYGIIDHEN